MKTTRDIVLISAPQKYNDRIEIEGGVIIYLDTSFKPEHHVSIKGIVEAVPGLLTPSHYANGTLEMELEVGDEVYFHYLTISPDNLVMHNDKEYYQVEYFNIFAYKRDGILHMNGGWVFVEPVTKASRFGNFIVPDAYKQNTSWDVGKLRHIGTPEKDQPTLDVSVGDYVLFTKNSKFENEVEGEVFYTMHQRDLTAVLNESSLSQFE